MSSASERAEELANNPVLQSGFSAILDHGAVLPSLFSPLQVTIHDPEIGLPNLVEAKHHALARSLRDTPTDRDLKPNAAVRDQLNSILGSVFFIPK